MGHYDEQYETYSFGNNSKHQNKTSYERIYKLLTDVRSESNTAFIPVVTLNEIREICVANDPTLADDVYTLSQLLENNADTIAKTLLESGALDISKLNRYLKDN